MLQTETALVYDGVQLFARALDTLPPHLSDVRVTSLSCNQDRAWKHGADLVSAIKTVWGSDFIITSNKNAAISM